MPESPIRLLVAASDDFAIPALTRLINNSDCEVVAVITQPDKPQGRGQTIGYNSVKLLVDSINSLGYDKFIPIYQPGKLREQSNLILQETMPDMVVVVAYGQMIPKVMLEAPRLGCINIHASLLPQLRGSVPIPMAIYQGLDRTGVSIQRMVAKLDAGDIYAQHSIELTGTETTEELKQSLAEMGAELLNDILPKLVEEQIVPVPQDESLATFCYQSDIAKENAEIKFDSDIELVERMIRAFNPWPVAWLEYGGQRLRIFTGQIASIILPANPEQRPKLARYGKRLFLLLRDGCIELGELQLEGKTRRPAVDYLFLAEERLSAI